MQLQGKGHNSESYTKFLSRMMQMAPDRRTLVPYVVLLFVLDCCTLPEQKSFITSFSRVFSGHFVEDLRTQNLFRV